MLAPSLSDLSDLTADVTYAETSSFKDSTDASSCTTDDSTVVAGGSKLVKRTGMAPPTLTTKMSSLTEEMRFLPNCHACLAEAIFWDEDSLREDGDSMEHVTISTTKTTTTTTTAAKPSPLKLTGRPLVYANPPAYYHYYHHSSRPSSSSSCREKGARQTLGLPMI